MQWFIFDSFCLDASIQFGWCFPIFKHNSSNYKSTATRNLRGGFWNYQEIRRLKEDSKTKEERNDYVVKYLTLGRVLAGCLIILMLVCTLFNFCQRRKNTGSKSINQMTEIQDKYADTAVQIRYRSYIT